MVRQIPYLDADTGLEFPVKWAMPSHETFNIIPIRSFIKKHCVGHKTIDLFPHPYSEDALSFLKFIPSNSIEYLLYDPIYSDRQQDEMYTIKGTNYKTHPEYFKKIEEELFRTVKSGGIVLKFMWNGKRIPGFEKFDGLIVEHGGQHNATICTAHRKIQSTLF
ncbi:adenine-specific DNA methylase [Nitrososphaeria virus YSH_462411]|uniref:Adenine-specific DNA methylase n=1 Tax=Nitrososphaeria virus YSH_462411 TaxID=3071321 RepID=A0A976UB73_9CAUD|nr:adenine-specific DNA methylase [Yangshan Harbor Nitrososphaeria virus]UVF62332.1 adenine-specific DNA methylase [Nitrososphaeria virus YSH_462411]